MNETVLTTIVIYIYISIHVKLIVLMEHANDISIRILSNGNMFFLPLPSCFCLFSKKKKKLFMLLQCYDLVMDQTHNPLLPLTRLF